MGDRAHRTDLGPRFSEGARLLWLALERARWTRVDLADALSVSSATVSRWLYGDRKPSSATAKRFVEMFGIPSGAWADPSTEYFTTPAVRGALAKLNDKQRAVFSKALEIASASFVANNGEERGPIRETK